jgi:hypothetical protein
MEKFALIVSVAVLALSFVTLTRAGLEDGLVLYLPFDEGAGETTGDLSGKDHDGDIVGATWTDGRFGKALSFNGDGDFVDVPYSDDFAITDGITLGAWVTANVPFPLNWKGIINARKSTYGPFLLQTGSNPATPLGEIGLYLGGAWTWAQTQTPLDENFHHLVGTYDPDDGYRMYFDGQPNDGPNSGAVAGPIDTDPGEEGVVIGHNYGYADRWWDGIIDEVVIYNRVLSEEEVAQLFEAPPVSAAVHYKGKLSTAWGKLKDSR